MSTQWRKGDVAVIEDVLLTKTSREVMFVVLEDSDGPTVNLYTPCGLEITVPSSWPERVMPDQALSSNSGQKMRSAHQ